ncbi:HNH endonuclease signature motif containing protein [Gemmatimonas sp.]|uniref:HNH endonuclease signature motif containing protein n=1 Tax=Gemmatimonas sp. TaxID=1962908 RepID=UPI0035613345
MTYPKEREDARLLDFIYVDPEHPQGCWTWRGSLNSQGYGSYTWKLTFNRTKHKGAHVAVYEHFVGPVPEGLVLDHICHDPKICRLGPKCPHRGCVNPEHLNPTTRQINSSSERSAAGRREQTHCLRGHPFDEENTYITPKGRSCKACKRAREAAIAEKVEEIRQAREIEKAANPDRWLVDLRRTSGDVRPTHLTIPGPLKDS